MASIFSFLGRRPPEPPEEPPDDPPIALLPPAGQPRPAHAAGAASDASTALTQMLTALQAFLPAAAPNLPAPTVTVLTVVEKPVGIGNLRGQEQRRGLSSTLLKGGRLLATVRFELWAGSPTDVGTLADNLHGALLAARPGLWPAGFLKITTRDTSLAAHEATLNGWRKALDYECLYEYHFEDSDGAQSLIARIPVHTDPEAKETPQRETNVVTDGLSRWDQNGAPALEIRGRATIEGLTALVFVPASPPTSSVTLLRTFTGASGPPADLPTLADFMDAVSAAEPQRHAQFTFPTFSNFLAQFTEVLDPLSLGDWNEDGLLDAYQGVAWLWSPPLLLAHSTDRFSVIYDPGNDDPALDHIAVVYLRTRPG